MTIIFEKEDRQLKITCDEPSFKNDIESLNQTMFLSPTIDGNSFYYPPTIDMLKSIKDYFVDKNYSVQLTDSMKEALERIEGSANKNQPQTPPKKNNKHIKEQVIVRRKKSDVDISVPENEDTNDKKDYVTLSRLFAKVSQVIQQNFSHNIWLKCEIANLKHANRGHVYLDLIETDKNGNELAKNKAIIWGNNSNKILRKFVDGTGSELQSGQKVLLLTRVSFDSRFGLNLSIEDIDPNFTLGDMEAKIKTIRYQLQKDGLYNINKEKELPFSYTHVAVISPNDAAGLKDFQIEADKLVDLDLCHFDYFNAIFQGKSTSQSIKKAISQVMHAGVQYDALIVIRGGGAKTDLHYLNDYDIAKMLTEVDMPVIVGIGHQIDHGILDEVSTITKDTPSKVIGYIYNRIYTVYSEIERFHQNSIYDLNNLITQSENIIDKNHTNNKTVIYESVNRYETLLDQLFYNIKTSCNQLIDNITNQINMNYQRNKHLMSDFFVKSEHYLDNQFRNNKQHLLNMITTIESDVDKCYNYSHRFDPKELFKKGFAAALVDNNSLVTSVDNIDNDNIIYLYVSDGIIKTTVNGKHHYKS